MADEGWEREPAPIADNVLIDKLKLILHLTSRCAKIDEGDDFDRDIEGITELYQARAAFVRAGSFPDQPTGEGEGRIVTRWEEAREMMGGTESKFYGPDALKQSLGINIPADRIPQLRMTVEEIENAIKCNTDIVLQGDVLRDGKPFTAMNLDVDFSKEFSLGDQNGGFVVRRPGNVLFSRGEGYNNLKSNPIANKAARLEWKQNGRYSMDKYLCYKSGFGKLDLLQKLDVLVDYFLIMAGSLTSTPLPAEYMGAIAGYLRIKERLESDMECAPYSRPFQNSSTYGESAARSIAGLRIIELLLPTLTDVCLDEVYAGNNRRMVTESLWIQGSDKKTNLAKVSGWPTGLYLSENITPHDRLSDLSVKFARSRTP